MMIARQIVVFDAADLTAESTFWAGLLGRTAGWHGRRGGRLAQCLRRRHTAAGRSARAEPCST